MRWPFSRRQPADPDALPLLSQTEILAISPRWRLTGEIHVPRKGEFVFHPLWCGAIQRIPSDMAAGKTPYLIVEPVAGADG